MYVGTVRWYYRLLCSGTVHDRHGMTLIRPHIAMTADAGFFAGVTTLIELQKSNCRWHCKNRQRQGAQILRNAV